MCVCVKVPIEVLCYLPKVYAMLKGFLQVVQGILQGFKVLGFFGII